MNGIRPNPQNDDTAFFLTPGSLLAFTPVRKRFIEFRHLACSEEEYIMGIAADSEPETVMCRSSRT
jgi:hypothetical protein